MKTKNKYFYNKLFEWLGKEIKEEVIKEKNIILDFERASMNALKKFFTSSKFYGCNFHLEQIVWIRVQNMKFAQEFMKNDEVKLRVKMILALGVVSIDDVLLLTARLNVSLKMEKSYDALRLFEWFKDEYLVENDSNKSISFLNVFDRTLNRIPRMISSIEEMHMQLNSLVKVKRATFFLILKELIIEQEITENKLLQSLYVILLLMLKIK